MIWILSGLKREFMIFFYVKSHQASSPNIPIRYNHIYVQLQYVQHTDENRESNLTMLDTLT